MGLDFFKSFSSYDSMDYSQPILPNPDPSNYRIINWKHVNHYLIITIKYLDCTNYEGIKILVYDKKYSLHQLKNQGSIDPHFSNSEKISPLARFEPTWKGIKMAEILCKNL